MKSKRTINEKRGSEVDNGNGYLDVIRHHKLLNSLQMYFALWKLGKDSMKRRDMNGEKGAGK